jgi:type IV pilus assembly protein PilP
MRRILTVAGIAATLGLAGCGDGLDDLRGDIEKAKQRPGGRIKPLPEVRAYVSHEYQMADRRSPFLQSLAGESSSSSRSTP